MTCGVCILPIDFLPTSCISAESRGRWQPRRVHVAVVVVVAVTANGVVSTHSAISMLCVNPVRSIGLQDTTMLTV